MARSLLLLTVSTLVLVTATAQAQNYVPPENYSGPNVVIDFGALDQANSAQNNRWVVAPVMQEPLAPPAAAVKLHPPILRKAMRMTPYAPAQGTTTQPAMVPDSAPMMASNPPPAQAAPAPSAMPATPLPPPTQFSAREMIDSAPPAPPVAAAAPVISQPSPAAPTMAATPPTSFSSKTGSMLAQARKNSSEKADRVNLASISDGPPMPLRSQQTDISKPVSADAKPVAKPVIAASKPVAKPVTVPKPAPIVGDDIKPVAASKASPSALPPSAALTDLEPSDNGAMGDVIKQATKTSPKPTPAQSADKPMQIASLPSSVKPLKDLDTESAPASSSISSNATNVSLTFAKDAGALDDAAKKDLDKIIKTLKSDSGVRAQIRAYASGTPETSGQARRLSLTRALAARSYVVDQNIPATRLDIRALGNGQSALDKPANGNLDRVDISLVK